MGKFDHSHWLHRFAHTVTLHLREEAAYTLKVSKGSPDGGNHGQGKVREGISGQGGEFRTFSKNSLLLLY